MYPQVLIVVDIWSGADRSLRYFEQLFTIDGDVDSLFVVRTCGEAPLSNVGAGLACQHLNTFYGDLALCKYGRYVAYAYKQGPK
jgi:hypothetical protein